MIFVIIALCCVAFYFNVKTIEKQRNPYIYEKTGKEYINIEPCLMKGNKKGEWIRAIKYLDKTSGIIYVREESDFFNKFINKTLWKELQEEKKLGTIM